MSRHRAGRRIGERDSGEAASGEVRLEELLGRRVRATNGRVIGRIEEIRAERHGAEHEVTEILIGPGALAERLAIRWPLSGRVRTRVARWDQIELDPIEDARLTCDVAELKPESPNDA